MLTPMNRKLTSSFRVPHRMVVVAGTLLVATAAIGADELAVARYSTIRAVPTSAQQDPLAGWVHQTIPQSVSRVGQAVEVLLAPSGYQLSGADAADPARGFLLELPLPEVHRELGPMPLRLALETLAGPAFHLVEDPLHRLVSFERCKAMKGER